jgi:uncharacterized repeat protein (TIGR04138 family)
MDNREVASVIDEIVRRDPTYARDAYEFVGEAVTYTTGKLGSRKAGRRHIRGQELLEGIREYALEQYGPLALNVLGEWGIRRTEDFGRIVFAMVQSKLLGASEEDSPEDFANGYDFEDAFLEPFVEQGTMPDSLPGILDT